MRIDHVALAVPDLDAAARALLEAHGLASTPTSPQPEWGTAHRLVPLGGGFLELVSVAHPEIAEKSPLGRRVRPEALGPVATRLGLTVGEGERHRSDGTAYSWQVAGVDVAVEHGLPFFIHWLASGSLPHRLPVEHEARPEGFAWIEVGGDLSRLADWLGPADLPLRRAHDERPLVRCALRTDRGEIVLGG
jgi:catechol 2,3-dioxygenase-like lactoylglutathione lyase family enzyme